MIIERKKYIEELKARKNNGLVKVITGIRRCGKSFLLFKLYVDYLKLIGIKENQIITLALDDDENIKYRNPIELGKYLRSLITDKDEQYYIILDEIQKVVAVQNPYIDNTEDKITFVDVVLSLIKYDNVDVYVTGSNSKMLSTDILTEFRGRSDEIRVYPLSYSEFYNSFAGEKSDAWAEYCTYGGMPYILTKKTHEEKSRYLKMLCNKIYISDICERNKINSEQSVLDDILNIISSSVGSLSNAYKIAKTFMSEKQVKISNETVSRYLDFFCDSFLISKVERYNVKGRKYIGSPLKYYFSDIGLRNARLNFRQTEENHIMENIIYNELCYRNFDVDIGVVEYYYKDENKKSKVTNLEIDFIANKGNKKYYFQSALNIDSEEKRNQEIKSLLHTNDSFKKTVIIKDNIVPHYDENGVFYIGIEKFLLNEELIDM